MADDLKNILLSVVLRQNQNNTTSPTNAFNLNNPAVQNYLTKKLKGILPNATGNITENELITAWLLANSGGGSGTVTSVDISSNGTALTISGNPITTAGTIAVDFNGANTDYVDGTGALQPFPTTLGTVTSVDLTMPSAFAVAGNPITTNGTLAVTGAGSTSQYIRGDGSLASFPSIPTVTPSNVTAGSTKISLGGTPTGAALQAFSIDVNEANLTLNNIGGTLGISKGGTNLTSLGTANQLLRVNALGTALEYFTPSYGTVTSIATAGLISGGTITGSGTITTSMATNRLVGRGTSGTGVMEEITLGSNLGLTGTTLNVIQNTRLNDNDTTAFYDYCGQAPLGTSQSSPTWLIRRINWSSTTPITQQATGAWTSRTSLIYT